MILDEKNRQNLIFLILQFLHEEGHRESLHLLEQESRIFFNFNYFAEAITIGNWEEAEKYLSAFTDPNENRFSRRMFFELYKWKYYETSDRIDNSERVNVLWKDLRRIPVFRDDAYDDLVELIALKDIRVKEQHCCMEQASARTNLCVDLKLLAHSNPCLQNKLKFPYLNKYALLSLIYLMSPYRVEGKGHLKEDLVCLVLQFLHEEKYKNTLHKLEQETRIFFNMNYLAELMVLSQFGKAEDYLTAFTDPCDNRHSKAMFLEIQKLKYLESSKRENKEPSECLDTISPRTKLRFSVTMLAKKNPALKDKLRFPELDKSRLLTLVKQILEQGFTPKDLSSQTCNDSISLGTVPIVPYLCDAPSLLSDKFNQTISSKAVLDCELTKINDPSECNALLLPDHCSEERITCLTYSPSGDFILALVEDATHRLWTWWSSQNVLCKGNACPGPRLHQAPGGKTMTNEIAAPLESTISCFAIKGSFIFSASGGRISVFDVKSFERVAAFGSPPPTATYFIFIPEDMIAIGLDDGSILIHCLSSRKVKAKLEGHRQKISCLAFSLCFNILVSSGADGQLCVWSRKSNGWEKLTSNFLQSLCTAHLHDCSSVSHIQFDPYHIELLVVHERYIGVHEAPTLECSAQWVPEKSDVPITSATYSCDGEIIYVCFKSGCIKVVKSKGLQTVCRINSSAYVQRSPTSSEVYPAVVAAHPSEPNQIAVGLSNGSVHVLEPLQSRGGWGGVAPRHEGDESGGSDHCY